MKLLFFDIDGTLIDFDGNMPDSTREALRLAKEAGHKIFLCSGRNEGLIGSYIKEIGFDGIISSTGACVSVGGKIIYQHLVSPTELKHLTSYFAKRRICLAVQAFSGTVMNQFSEEWLYRRFHEMNLTNERIRELFGEITISEALDEIENVEKFCYYDADEPIQKVQEYLGDYFLVTASSFRDSGDYCGEITCTGINKALGIQKVMEYYQLDRQDTIAFGDGPNDLDMLEYAGIGVAMGNACEEAKKVADRLTATVNEDGILKAMRSLGLIE